jgi:hypothetical protein
MLLSAVVTFWIVTCTVVTFAVTLQAVPYWVDDESVRPSMLLSAVVTFWIVTCTVVTFAVTLQAVPYWVDDESVRPSMLLSAPPARAAAADAASSSRAAGNGQHVTVEVQEEVRRCFRSKGAVYLVSEAVEYRIWGADWQCPDRSAFHCAGGP